MAGITTSTSVSNYKTSSQSATVTVTVYMSSSSDWGNFDKVYIYWTNSSTNKTTYELTTIKYNYAGYTDITNSNYYKVRKFEVNVDLFGGALSPTDGSTMYIGCKILDSSDNVLCYDVDDRASLTLGGGVLTWLL